MQHTDTMSIGELQWRSQLPKTIDGFLPVGPKRMPPLRRRRQIPVKDADAAMTTKPLSSYMINPRYLRLRKQPVVEVHDDVEVVESHAPFTVYRYSALTRDISADSWRERLAQWVSFVVRPRVTQARAVTALGIAVILGTVVLVTGSSAPSRPTTVPVHAPSRAVISTAAVHTPAVPSTVVTSTTAHGTTTPQTITPRHATSAPVTRSTTSPSSAATPASTSSTPTTTTPVATTSDPSAATSTGSDPNTTASSSSTTPSTDPLQSITQPVTDLLTTTTSLLP